MKRFAILWNILIMILLSGLILFGIIEGLKIYTRQNAIIRVPNLKGQTLNEALKTLESCSLSAEVVDSIYQRDQMPSSIYDVVPEEGASVKEGRTIYLKIYSSTPTKKGLPDVKDLPLRAAEERLKRLGFIHFSQKEVEGLHKGLCVGLEDSEGNLLEEGKRVGIDTELVLLVSGKQVESLTVDDLIASDSDSVPPVDTISVVEVIPEEKQEENKPDDWF